MEGASGRAVTAEGRADEGTGWRRNLAFVWITPFWGTLADRFGRKPMYLRALAGAGITILLTGLCQVARQPGRSSWRGSSPVYSLACRVRRRR